MKICKNIRLILYVVICACVLGGLAKNVQAAGGTAADIKAQETAWELINNYADPDYFLYDPYRDTTSGIFIGNPMSDEEYQILKAEAEATISSHSTQYEKIEAIFNYVRTRVRYDFSYSSSLDSPYETWYNKKGVCDNYARLMKTMLVSVNIPCMTIIGYNHAYNAAYDATNDRWIFVDATNSAFDLSPNQCASYTMYEVSELEGLLYNNLYYNLYTGYDIGKKWNSMDWQLIVGGVKDTTAKSAGVTSSLCGITVTKIGDMAFYQWENLQSITIPDSITETGIGAFTDSGLKSIDLSDTSITVMKWRAFQNCDKLTNVVLPDGLKELGENSFDGCTSLKTIDLSNTALTKIEHDMFASCSSLASIKFPSTLTEIGARILWTGGRAIKVIDLSNTKVTTIGNWAFSGCSNLVEIKLPSTLTTIGELVFDYCSRLESIDFSGTKLSSIGERAFQYCSGLKTIKFPATLTTMGEGICFGCESLTEIDLSNTKLTAISDYAFSGCDSMDVIKLPDTLTSIGKMSFSADGYNKVTYIISKYSEDKLRDMGYEIEGDSPWYPSFAGRKLYAGKGLYTITYKLNGGTNSDSNPSRYMDTSSEITLYDPQRSGYSFGGWYSDSSLTQRVTSIKTGSTGNKTLYAKWIVDEQETTTKKQEVTTKKEETTTKKQEVTTKREETTTKKQEVTTKKEETSTKKQEITTKREETATKESEATTEIEETTVQEQETTTQGENITTSREATTTRTEDATDEEEAISKNIEEEAASYSNTEISNEKDNADTSTGGESGNIVVIVVVAVVIIAAAVPVGYIMLVKKRP